MHIQTYSFCSTQLSHMLFSHMTMLGITKIHKADNPYESTFLLRIPEQEH